MLRTTNPQPSLWEAILPDACLGLPAELARVDRLLDAPAFLAPLTSHFDPRIGRPCVPLDTYLRMMFLKFRYRLGYELVCREVAANEAYPTDAGLLARAIGKLQTTIQRIQATGGAARTRVRDRRRATHRRAHQLARSLRARTDQAKQQVAERTAELATLAEQASADAARVARNASRALARAGGQASGKLARLVDELQTTIGRTGQVIAQTRTRLAGGTPDGATRLVSLHDPDARPIVKGRLGKPVEFGYKAQVADNPDGVVLDDQVELGNPPDAPLLAPAVRRIAARTGRTPKAVTADRSYGEAAVDQDLHALGVERVAIPRKGQPGAARQATEHARGFPRLVKWRTGCEGRISHLKHRYGWDRTLMTASTAPGSGAGRACWPTTWSRSAG